MIEKIFDCIRHHFRRHEYEYHYWLERIGKFIWLWIKTGVIVILVVGAFGHAIRISNGQGTDADTILLIIEVITLLTVFAWYIGTGDDY